MNKKAIHTLEFDKIQEQLIELAGSSLGKQHCKNLRPSSDISQIQLWQKETGDALSRLFRKGNLSFSGVSDIRASLKRLEIGSILGAGELLRVRKLLEIPPESRLLAVTIHQMIKRILWTAILTN